MMVPCLFRAWKESKCETSGWWQFQRSFLSKNLKVSAVTRQKVGQRAVERDVPIVFFSSLVPCMKEEAKYFRRDQCNPLLAWSPTTHFGAPLYKRIEGCIDFDKGVSYEQIRQTCRPKLDERKEEIISQMESWLIYEWQNHKPLCVFV